MAYNAHGRLRVEVGTPIYECNKICKCDTDCTNRVVQRGRKVKLCIYRTDNGCGWGVKALENIKKGSFVVEYVGEVITSEEAEKRGEKYEKEESDQHEDGEEVKVQSSMKMECRCGAENCRKILFG